MMFRFLQVEMAKNLQVHHHPIHPNYIPFSSLHTHDLYACKKKALPGIEHHSKKESSGRSCPESELLLADDQN